MRQISVGRVTLGRRFSGVALMLALGLVLPPARVDRNGLAAAPRQDAGVTISTAARALQPGEVVQFMVTGLATTDAAQVRVFNRTFGVFQRDGRHLALVGIDLDVRPGTYVAAVERLPVQGAPVRIGTHALIVRTKAFPTRRLTVEPRYVDPPPAEAARIERDARRLTALWETRTPALWHPPFTAPVPDPATSAFGSRSVFNGQTRNPHAGADFSSPRGRPVRAPAAGRVVLADDLYFTGGTVVLDHGLGLLSLFAHLSATSVAEGDLVEPGTMLGEVGATGRVTGPHLHWTVRLAGTRVDPLSLIAVTAEHP